MIVVIGEALIDLIQDRTQSDSYRAVVGGANANVAIALARRGTKQQFLCRLSGDGFGKQIRERLRENKVGLDYAIDANEPTTLAIASIADHGGANYSFYLTGTADWGWSDRELPSLDTLKKASATALQFGCLTMAMPPGNLVIEAWAKKLFDNNQLTISHDVNVRPAIGFESQKERLRVERINSISHLIKASDDDIAWLYGASSEEIDNIVYGWIADSERVVFVTRGGDGVSIYRKNKTRLDIPARKTEIVDTVGAGDTFCAHVLGQLEDLSALGENPFERLAKISNQQLQEISRVAAVAASLTCERTGAEPPTKKELEAFLN